MEILQSFELPLEVNRKGHIELPKSKIREYILPDIHTIPFEFSKDRTIVYFPVKFTKHDLETYYKKTPPRERKVIRCAWKRNIIRFYFNTSKRLDSYYPQKVKIYHVKRALKEKSTEELAFDFYDIAQIVQTEVETSIIAAKYLSLKRLIPPLIAENLLRLDSYITTRYYSLQSHHTEEYRDVYDILITFDPLFIESLKKAPISLRRKKNMLEGKPLNSRIRKITDSKINEIRFHLGKNLFSGFMRKHGPTQVKVFFLDENILITTDRRLKLPQDFRPITMEYIDEYKKGLSDFSKKSQNLPLDDKKNTLQLNYLLTLIKLAPEIHTKFHSEFVKGVYSNFFLLLDVEHLFTYGESSMDEELQKPTIRILAIYFAFEEYYGDYETVLKERFFYRFYVAHVIKASNMLHYFGDVSRLPNYYEPRKKLAKDIIGLQESKELIINILKDLKKNPIENKMLEHDLKTLLEFPLEKDHKKK